MPTNPCNHNAPWTDDRNYELWRLWTAKKKLDVHDIADRLGRTSATCYYQAKKLGLPPRRKRVYLKRKDTGHHINGRAWRLCLGCQQQFLSEHTGNRLCDECAKAIRIML